MQPDSCLQISHAGVRVRQLQDFKEQLSVLLIALLFILLSASVRLEDVHRLGWPGVATVVTLMIVVRPLMVWICTVGCGLSMRQRLFLGWLAPRGIVAAAIATLFAEVLIRNGEAKASELKALVFLVIASTVVIQGLSARKNCGTSTTYLQINRFCCGRGQRYWYCSGKPTAAGGASRVLCGYSG